MKQKDKLGQLLGDKKALEQVARSPDAQALAGILAQTRDNTELKQIAESAAKGDTAQLRQLIASITSTPGGAELLRRIGDSFSGN